jgi:hypothetical protein
MKQTTIALLCAMALTTLACAGNGTPTRPTELSAVSDQAIGSPAMGLAHAVANCRGPVFDALRKALSASSLAVISDDGSTFSFTFAPTGGSHTLTYIDNDTSGRLSCGDTIISAT